MMSRESLQNVVTYIDNLNKNTMNFLEEESRLSILRQIKKDPKNKIL